MISVAEASEIILNNLYRPSLKEVPLKEAVGKVLGESIFADRDFPPFDRVAMDGIAVSSQQLSKGQYDYMIEGIQAAGKPQQVLQDATKCLEVMTGAVLPAGTDTVIRYEDVEMNNHQASVRVKDFKKGQHVHGQGHDVLAGAELLSPGIRISPAEIALLASVGKSRVKVKSYPAVSLVSTGEELVEISSVPQKHQIRKSNVYALYSALLQLGITANLHHIVDDPRAMEQELTSIKEHSDTIILSGGVSKGKYDFVPQVLETLNVRKLFHQVSQRPGKPFWFGISEEGKSFFAFPGNPVSTYLCFYNYFRPWLWQSLGVKGKTLRAILAEDFTFAPSLSLFLQVRIDAGSGMLMATPVPGAGSGDFANLKDVDGFLELDAKRSEFKAGEVFPYIPFRH